MDANTRKAIHEQMELAGKLVDKASELLSKTDTLTREIGDNTIVHKLADYTLREQYAKAMVLLYKERQARLSDMRTAHCPYFLDGRVCTEPAATTATLHTYSEWLSIWQRVYDKVHAYRKNLAIQWCYGRNPTEICTAPIRVEIR